MPSEKKTDHKGGFILSADAFQAMVREIQGSMLSNDKERYVLIVCHLKDGRLLDFTSADQVIQLDNSGISAIETIHIIASGNQRKLEDIIKYGFFDRIFSTLPSRGDNIHVLFSNSGGIFDREKVETYVSSENDDFSLVIWQRLESKLKDILCPKLVNGIYDRNISTIGVMGLTIIFAFMLSLSYSSLNVGEAISLRTLYEQGRFKDAIDFMIYLRETDPRPDSAYRMLYLILIICLSVLLAFSVHRFLKFLFPINIFAWGGGLRTYNLAVEWRRRTFNIVFVAVLLALAVGLLGDWLSRTIFSP